MGQPKPLFQDLSSAPWHDLIFLWGKKFWPPKVRTCGPGGVEPGWWCNPCMLLPGLGLEATNRSVLPAPRATWRISGIGFGQARLGSTHTATPTVQQHPSAPGLHQVPSPLVCTRLGQGRGAMQGKTLVLGGLASPALAGSCMQSGVIRYPFRDSPVDQYMLHTLRRDQATLGHPWGGAGRTSLLDTVSVTQSPSKVRVSRYLTVFVTIPYSSRARGAPEQGPTSTVPAPSQRASGWGSSAAAHSSQQRCVRQHTADRWRIKCVSAPNGKHTMTLRKLDSRACSIRGCPHSKR